MKDKQSFFYGLGNLGYGVVSQTYSNFIMFFGTGVLGISGSIMGILIAISTLWDGFNDPFIGYLSDKFKNRHKFIIFGFVGMSIINVLLWCVPNCSTFFKCAWLLLFMMLLETFNTCFHVPYSALSAEMGENDEEALSYQKYKSIFFILSMLFPTIFMLFFFNGEVGMLSQSGYIFIGIITSLICLVGGILCYKYSKKTLIKVLDNQPKSSFKESMIELYNSIKLFFSSFKDKNYSIIIVGYCLSLVICAFVTSLGFHAFNYSFAYSSMQVNILLFSLILFSILGQFFWTRIANKRSKKIALVQGELLASVGLLLLFLNYLNVFKLSIEVSFIFSIILVGFVGFCSTVLYSIPLAIFNKIIINNNKENNRLDTASHTGMLMLTYQIFNAITSIILGVFLDVIKFDSNNIIQTQQVNNSIVNMLLIGLFIIFIICATLHSFLDENKTN